MQRQPLPIPGLPIAPAVPGLTVLEDIGHSSASASATAARPRRPLAPFPVTHRPAPALAPAAAHGDLPHSGHDPLPTTGADDPDCSFFPTRRFRKAIPEFVPVRPEAFAAHQHPLAIRTPLDVVRFFPITLSLAATLAGLSGMLAGGIANHLLGGIASPAIFMAGYLGLFVLNLWTHYFAAKGQLFFVNKARFLRLLAANALLLLPHFIAYSLLQVLVK